MTVGDGRKAGALLGCLQESPVTLCSSVWTDPWSVQHLHPPQTWSWESPLMRTQSEALPALKGPNKGAEPASLQLPAQTRD